MISPSANLDNFEAKKLELMQKAGIDRPPEDLYYIKIKIGKSVNETLIYRFASFNSLKVGLMKDLFCPLCVSDLFFRWKGQLLHPQRTPELYGIKSGDEFEVREIKVPNQTEWAGIGSELYLAPSNMIHPLEFPTVGLEYFHLPETLPSTNINNNISALDRTSQFQSTNDQQYKQENKLDFLSFANDGPLL